MSTSLSLLEPGFRESVRSWLNWLRENGVSATVTSTRRSRSEQEALYLRYIEGRSVLPAAPPGRSSHECGRAIDVVFGDIDQLSLAVEVAPEFGLSWLGPDDPVHFSWLGHAPCRTPGEAVWSTALKGVNFLNPFSALLELGSIALSEDVAAEYCVDLGLC